jgi:pyruvate dehydrogenase E1 component
MSSFIAAGTAYANLGVNMIPFYIYYSMFGFQRVGDFIWCAADSRCKGFLLGGTAGRTTLNGEGLQHEDGHSHLLASVVPNVHAYDPAFAYEVATIIRDGIKRMYTDGEDIFYYLTLYNQDYSMPAMPAGVEDGILRGMYLYRSAVQQAKQRAQIFGSGVIMLQALRAQEILSKKFDVAADVWSVTSYQQLRDDALVAERWNRLHPGEPARVPYVTKALENAPGPVIAATDYMRSFADQVRSQIPRRFFVLGTDGFGRSDYRVKLRKFFEVNRYYVVVAALKALADEGEIKPEVVDQAIKKYGLDTERPDPWTV